MDTAPAGGGPGAQLRNPGCFLQLPNTKCCLKTLHTAPQGPQSFLARYELLLGAYVEIQPGRCPGWAWGGWCTQWHALGQR